MKEAVRIENYVPEYIREYRESKLIYEKENQELKRLWDMAEQVLSNLFIESADEIGIKRMEQMLDITAKKEVEDLEFRRERLFNRINLMPPFTLPFLRSQLNQAIGSGQYQVYVDHKNYTLYLESFAANQNWFEEISFTINKIKPANIVFINKPLLAESICIAEEISGASMLYQCRLGFWQLGETPFVEFIHNRILKRRDEMSIKEELLSGLARETVKKVDHVQINNDRIITEFSLKAVKDMDAIIEYTVKAAEITSGRITNVKLFDSTDQVLFDSNVYVPIDADTLVKHTICLKEGV